MLTLILTMVADDWENQNNRLQFERRAKRMADALENHAANYLGTIQFIGDFFYNSSDVSRSEFAHFTRGAFMRYPAIKAFYWAPLVKNSERENFEISMRNQGIKGFRFREMSKDLRLVPSKTRVDYFPISYIEPMVENSTVLGFDIASEPVRKKALLQGFHSGEARASGRINLAYELGSQAAILVVLPIYKRGSLINTNGERFHNLIGFVAETLVISEIVEAALASFSDLGLELALYDNSEDAGGMFLHAYPAGPGGPFEARSDQSLTRALDFAGREWLIRITPTAGYLQGNSHWHSRAIFTTSLLFTLILSYYLYQKMVAGFHNEQRMKKEMEINKRLEQEIALREREEARLRRTQQNLEREIKERISIEKQRDRSIVELTQALAEVRSLRGILPLCSFCKKIRDDKGYWEQVDVYIHKHSQADISHSICPQCMKQHYPDEFDEIYGDKT